jgi:hypothetical protein
MRMTGRIAATIGAAVVLGVGLGGPISGAMASKSPPGSFGSCGPHGFFLGFGTYNNNNSNGNDVSTYHPCGFLI